MLLRAAGSKEWEGEESGRLQAHWERLFVLNHGHYGTEQLRFFHKIEDHGRESTLRVSAFNCPGTDFS